MKRTGFRKQSLEEVRKKQALKKAKTPRKRAKHKKTTRTTKKKKPSLRILKNKLWAECKRIVRLRYQRHDGNWNCYTCDQLIDALTKAQTGHFIPSSVCSTEMRYDLDNLRIQDYRCNINLSGNWIEYEKRLNEEMGEGFTDKLKQRNEQTKGEMYRADWYEAKIAEYKQIV